jgi:hypothetical protein
MARSLFRKMFQVDKRYAGDVARVEGSLERKNNFARGYRRFGLGLDQIGKRNWELGLDE